MMKKSTIAAALALACGLFSATASHAALTAYTSRSAFYAALTNVLVDSYNDLNPTDVLASPASVTLGGYGYTVAAPGGLFAAGSNPDVWLGTYLSNDALSLGSFTGGVAGVGADVFLSDITGALAGDGSITVTGFDADGPLSRTFAFSSLTNFIGFISDTGSVGAMVITNNAPGNDDASARFVTINDLALGSANAVPEPGSIALVLGALALLPLGARRKSA